MISPPLLCAARLTGSAYHSLPPLRLSSEERKHEAAGPEPHARCRHCHDNKTTNKPGAERPGPG